MFPAHRAADILAAASIPRSLVGFDGFIDEIIAVVDRRRDMTPGGYDPIRTIADFAARVGSAAGKSSNLELVVKEERWGGNGPLFAGALASLGSEATYVGAVGKPDAPIELDPRYAEFAARCREVIPVAPPAHTDALEFEDGKIMLGKPANVQVPTWELLLKVMGEPRLIEVVDSSRLIGIVNWVMMVGVEGIWEGLIGRVFPLLSSAPRRVFIDLADPAKRTDSDIRRAMEILRRMNEQIPVTLGLNLAEAERMTTVFGVGSLRGASRSLGSAVESAARDLRDKLALNTVVVHPREGAGAASAIGTSIDSAWFDGPFTPTPRLSTGAGDHFNAGFALGQVLQMSVVECLAAGCGTSGAYVRDARSPTRQRLVEFLRTL
jgi:sugar/nucleoside kinase (ribokinase family)